MKSAIPESALKIETMAKIIAEKGDVVKFLVNQAHKNHKGDTNTIKLLYASIASTNSGTSAGIQPGINGDPGIGKTDAAKAVAHTIPDCWKKVATLTAMAIYYANIKPGTIILSDDVDWSGGLIGTMKRSMGDFQNPQEKMNVSSDRESLNQFIPERLAWWVTCVDSVANDQLKDRQYSLDIEEEMNHKKIVSTYTGVRRSIKKIRYAIDLGIEIARWIIKDIKDHELFKVVIDCAAVAEWKMIENHRAQNKFWDLVEAFAILRYRQRFIDEDGWLHASVQDFNDAKELFERSADSHRSNLTKPQIRVIESIIKLQKYNNGASQAMIAVDVDRSIVSVCNALKAIEANTRYVTHERGEHGEQRYRCTIKDFEEFYLSSFEEIVSLSKDYQDTFIKCAV